MLKGCGALKFLGVLRCYGALQLPGCLRCYGTLQVLVFYAAMARFHSLVYWSRSALLIKFVKLFGEFLVPRHIVHQSLDGLEQREQGD